MRRLSPDVAIPVLNDRLPLSPDAPTSELDRETEPEGVAGLTRTLMLDLAFKSSSRIVHSTANSELSTQSYSKLKLSFSCI